MTTIIAEIGINHCGDMRLAKSLILLAKDNGASLVKFQLYEADKLDRTPETKKLLKAAQLSKGDATELFRCGEGYGIEVFFSVFDVERVEWCEQIGVKRYKVACSEDNNKPLLKAIFATHKECIISTEMEYDFYHNGDHMVKTLFCAPGYPAAIHNLWFVDDFDGFSDHTIGLTASKIAIARGCGIVERHFAIDHKTGADAEWSMTPPELRELVQWSKEVEAIL